MTNFERVLVSISKAEHMQVPKRTGTGLKDLSKKAKITNIITLDSIPLPRNPFADVRAVSL